MQPSVIHSTFVIERSFAASPGRVFDAFADPAQKKAWYAASGRHAGHYEMDFRTGGHENVMSPMGEDTPFPGVPLINTAVFNDIVPNRRVVMSSTMSLGDRRISAQLVTFEFLPEGSGTRLLCTHQGAFFEGSDGPEMRRQGWDRLFDGLGACLAQG